MRSITMQIPETVMTLGMAALLLLLAYITAVFLAPVFMGNTDSPGIRLLGGITTIAVAVTIMLTL